MIWITGDLHGGATAYHVSSSVFKPAKRGDIVICTGDFGGVWWHDYLTNEKHRREEDYFLESKLRKRVLWLAVDGNHENFARLFGGEFPLVDLYGGKAYMIRENVYYLKRGEVFAIEGKTFLAFGGAKSHDKNPGWITGPLSSYGFGGREWNRGRTEGVDWWPEEVPSEEDYDNACRNLDKVDWKVDYVITHTCPESQLDLFDKARHSKDPTERLFQDLVDRKLEFREWHFGHFHWEHQEGRYFCHFDKVKQLPGDLKMKKTSIEEISGLVPTIWNVAPIDEDPEITLTDWTVFEVTSGLWSDKTRHFVGYNVSDREGRVSSAIVQYDQEKALGMTQSGRIYRLKGKQGSGSPDGLHVWAFWCRRNEVSNADETSLAY